MAATEQKRAREEAEGRSERARRAILDATRELLAEQGVRELTVEGVASRAGVAKTTIYRRWRGKDELALAVLLDMVEQVVATPDLGDTRAELVAFVDAAVTILGSTLMGRVMQGLVSDLAGDADLGRAFRERVVAMRLAEGRRGGRRRGGGGGGPPPTRLLPAPPPPLSPGLYPPPPRGGAPR